MCVDPVTMGVGLALSDAGKGLGDNFRDTFGIETQADKNRRREADAAAQAAADQRKYEHQQAMADRGYARTDEYTYNERAANTTSEAGKSVREEDYLDQWRGSTDTPGTNGNSNRDSLKT